ncbi:MAG TPA: EamA family transporter [Chthoniobacterales bacterium]|jgi:multidrug transporter EmrE-like cation transporter|nr:EamA family transporter [Chthoniobacterales bacterium]
MTAVAMVIVLAALVSAVAGQILLKKAMGASHTDKGFRTSAVVVPFAIGIALMTMQFFLILGLLQRYDLSFIYPFQGLGVIIITFAAAITLREKLTFQLVLGSVLITAGVVLVSMT